MVIGEFGEILFWDDISKILQKEQEMRTEYEPNKTKDGAQRYNEEKMRFVKLDLSNHT